MKHLILFVGVCLCFSCMGADQFEIRHDSSGKFQCINEPATGKYFPASLENADYRRFIAWNAARQTPLSIADKAPTPDTAAETEHKRKLALAVTYVKAVPESWENGTNEQKIMWAMKRILIEIKSELKTP